jgi:SAM-dependent methyltransferase
MKSASGAKVNAKSLRDLSGLILKRRCCPLCGWGGFRFDPYGNKMVFRPDARCPACGSLERHRAAFVLLRDKLRSEQKVLHVAPERPLIPWIVSLSSEYLTGDLYQPSMRRIDLTSMDLPDSSKTLVWCSHVLDDIPDDRKALSEIFRILAPGGHLVLQVTIGGYATYEDASITSKSARLEVFFHEDHVRLYGLDIQGRMEEAGFTCEVLSTLKLPPSEQILYALNAPLYREVFLGRKPDPS